MKKIDFIVGTRPNFVKIAPIMKQLEAIDHKDLVFRYRLIHTGQHYDKAMSESFFSQLGIRAPHQNLEVKSGSQAQQVADIMVEYEKYFLEKKSDMCVVVGDVNSTMACAIVAAKLSIPVIHIESGLRSNDMSMPEEVNRIVTDSIATWHFTTTENAGKNLMGAGVPSNKIFFVGNLMIDTLISNMDKLRPPKVWDELNLEAKKYFILTMHRPSNVDNTRNIARIIKVLQSSARGQSIIFPVHPRLKDKLLSEEIDLSGVILTEPMGYLEFNFMVKNSLGVVTDSGGISEETTFMGIPCVTLRENTERPETVDIGTNELVGFCSRTLAEKVIQILNNDYKIGRIPEKWDGQTAIRIVRKLEEIVGKS